MANHKSAKKRIRSNETKRLRNRYYSRSMRSSLKKFRLIEKKSEASEKINEMISMIDKQLKRGLIHKNKAANLKSKLTKKVNALA